MITLIFIATIIVVAIFLYHRCNNKDVKKVKIFDEKKIIDKFNKLVQSIGPRNMDIIKNELLNCLDEYRALKRQQFIDARTLLTASMDAIDNEIFKVKEALSKKEGYLRNHKEELSDYDGAKLCYERDLYSQMVKKLFDSKDKIVAQLAELDKRIISFDTQLQLKRTQVVTMINESFVIDNCSAIDLKLDSLEKEFKGEVNKLKQTQVVDEKMGNIKKEEELAFDVDHYTQIFKELK